MFWGTQEDLKYDKCSCLDDIKFLSMQLSHSCAISVNKMLLTGPGKPRGLSLFGLI